MDNYYDNSQRWVYDSDGNYLHSNRNESESNLQREGYFFSDVKMDKIEYERYLLERKNNND